MDRTDSKQSTGHHLTQYTLSCKPHGLQMGHFLIYDWTWEWWVGEKSPREIVGGLSPASR